MEKIEYGALLIDVRESEEFAAQRIPGSINLPLSSWENCAPKLAQQFRSSELTFTCLSGTRAKMAAQQWDELTGSQNAKVLEGGLKAHLSRGGRVDGVGRSESINLFRQVQMIVGPVVFGSSLLASIGWRWAALPGVVIGLGLSIAGYTGFCGMAVLLSKLPFNRLRSENKV